MIKASSNEIYDFSRYAYSLQCIACVAMVLSNQLITFFTEALFSALANYHLENDNLVYSNMIKWLESS